MMLYCQLRSPTPVSLDLPGVHLGGNFVATSNMQEAVEGADVVVLCVPHQYMREARELRLALIRNAMQCVAKCACP